MTPTKTCTVCGLPKELKEFPRQTQTPDGRKANCKACENEKRKQRIKEKEQYSKTFFTY